MEWTLIGIAVTIIFGILGIVYGPKIINKVKNRQRVGKGAQSAQAGSGSRITQANGKTQVSEAHEGSQMVQAGGDSHNIQVAGDLNYYDFPLAPDHPDLQIYKPTYEPQTPDSLKNQAQHDQYQAVTKAWGLLDEAIGRMSVIISPLQRYPDLSTMSEQELSGFIERHDPPMGPEDAQRLLDVPTISRNDVYRRLVFWLRLNTAREAWREFNNHVSKNRIYIPAKLYDQLEKINKLIDSALKKREVDERVSEFSYDFYNGLNNQIETTTEEIIQTIQKFISRLGIDFNDDTPTTMSWRPL